jgi:hypothetical protein
MKKSNRKSEYSQKLLDPRWQKKRLEVLQRDDWTCQGCGDKNETLHVHHRCYVPDKEPWDIEDRLLVTMCAACHEQEKGRMATAIRNLTRLVKERFLSTEVDSIVEGLAFLAEGFSSARTSNVLRKVLQSGNAMKHMDEYCDKYLTKKTTINEDDEVF